MSFQNNNDAIIYRVPRYNGVNIVYFDPKITPYEKMTDLRSETSDEFTKSLNAMFSMARNNKCVI